MSESKMKPDRLARLRDLCLALPEATEKEAWGDPTWRVRDKIFAMQKGNFRGARPSLWIKGDDGAQSMLVQTDPARYFVPPYVGSKGWIGVYVDGRSIDWGELGFLIETSYRLIAPKRLAEALTAPAKAAETRGRPRARGPAARPGSSRRRSRRARGGCASGPRRPARRCRGRTSS